MKPGVHRHATFGRRGTWCSRGEAAGPAATRPGSSPYRFGGSGVALAASAVFGQGLRSEAQASRSGRLLPSRDCHSVTPSGRSGAYPTCQWVAACHLRVARCAGWRRVLDIRLRAGAGSSALGRRTTVSSPSGGAAAGGFPVFRGQRPGRLRGSLITSSGARRGSRKLLRSVGWPTV